jgi:hypothetical protein
MNLVVQGPHVGYPLVDALESLVCAREVRPLPAGVLHHGAYLFRDVYLDPVVEQEVQAEAQRHQVDAAFVPADRQFENMHLVTDMDGTIIENDTFRELIDRYGMGDAERLLRRQRDAQRSAHRYEANYEDPGKAARWALLHGCPLSTLEALYDDLRFTPGAEQFLRRLKVHGARTACIATWATVCRTARCSRMTVSWSLLPIGSATW